MISVWWPKHRFKLFPGDTASFSGIMFLHNLIDFFISHISSKFGKRLSYILFGDLPSFIDVEGLEKG